MSSYKRKLNPYAPESHWRKHILIAVVLLVVGVLIAACDVHGVSEPGTLASITVTPNATLAASSTQQMVAVGRDADGRVVEIAPTWSITASGGTVSSAGVFTAGMSTGVFANTVRATVGGISGTASITVTAGALASIGIMPNPATVAVTGTQQFVAVGRDAGGNIVQVTPTWSVVAGGGSIAQTGVFTAGAAPGTFTNTVQVSAIGITAFATVNVTAGPVATIVVTPATATLAGGAQQQFTATGRDAAGNTVTLTPIWSVVAGGGTIDAVGRFTAGSAPGTFTNTVVATSGSISGRASVTVTPALALASITVTPDPATVQVGTTRQFAAVGRDQNNNVFPFVATWTVVNGGGSINAASGLFTAGAVAGTFPNTVQAASGAITGTATVTVTVAPVPPPSGGGTIGLGAAAPNGIMAGTAVTCVTGGLISADVSISPGNTLTGFGPCVITGVQHLGDAVAAQGQIDLTTAYNTLAGMACAPANAIVGNLGGTTKPAGTYCTASGIGVTGVLTLDGGGDPNATFVFQAGTSLTTAGSIVLINGAQARNVYWQVGSSATIGTASAWQGNILALTSITLVDGATLTGRALARNGAVSLGTNNIITLP